MVDELPPEAYEGSFVGARPELPLRGYFAPPAPAEESGEFLRVNAFRDLQSSIASACTGLPAAASGRPFKLVREKPQDEPWLAGVLELVELPDPALVGLDRFDPTWWQGVTGAARAETALRAVGVLIGFVVQE